MLGCATAPVPETATMGAIAWRVTAFQRVPTTIHDRPGERYTFTLLVRHRTGAGITVTRVTQTVSARHVPPVTTTQDGQWRLPPRGELSLPFRLVWSCPAVAEGCSALAGRPHWHILLTGSDDHGNPIELSLEVDAPAVDTVLAQI